MSIPSGSDPGLSLVVTTLGRTVQVERLLRSLAVQSHADFEVVVVDQNNDDRLCPILEQDWPFPLKRFHTPGERGASRGRNRGWMLARGPVVVFPDDDCWYAPDFLRTSLTTMRHHACDMLTGRATDETGRSINGRFRKEAQPTDAVNVWTTAIEWMVFFRRPVLEGVGGFDAGGGGGAATPWQSCEIQDIIIRAMNAGFSCWYDPSVIGHHENLLAGIPDVRLTRKARAYARGMGFVLRLHGYGPLAIGAWIARPLARGVVSVVQGRPGMLRYSAQVALGRLEGALRRTVGSG